MTVIFSSLLAQRRGEAGVKQPCRDGLSRGQVAQTEWLLLKAVRGGGGGGGGSMCLLPLGKNKENHQ